MRRVLLLGTSVLAAGVLIASQATAVAASSFSVFAFGHAKFIVAPGTNPHHLSRGDEFIVTDVLTSTQRDDGRYKILGRDAGQCVITHAKKNNDARAQCNVTANLKNEGSITVQGSIGFRHGHLRPSTLAVTGGTGDFESSGGTLFIEPGKHHNEYTFSLT